MNGVNTTIVKKLMYIRLYMRSVDWFGHDTSMVFGGNLKRIPCLGNKASIA